MKFPAAPDVPGCIEELVRDNPAAHCCSVRVKGTWQEFSRREFWDRVCHYAGLFAPLPHQSIVLFVKQLDIHLLAAYIGAMKAGHLPAQISYPSSKVNPAEYGKKLGHIHEITRFGAVFTDQEGEHLFEQFGSLPIFTPGSAAEPSDEDFSRANENALVQFSSGSTGMQKGVVLTHEGVVEHMKSYAATLRLTEGDAIATWLPLYHDMGLIACYLMPLMTGIPFYQIDPFDWIMQPDLLLQLVEERRPTICFLPNFTYQVLAQKGKVRDLSSVRLWINCSEPARAKSHAMFAERFPTVKPESLTVCYALAENTFAVSQTLPWSGNSTRVHPARNVLSCGKPIPGVEVRIFDPMESGDGEVGIRSPFLFHRFLDGTRPLRDGFCLTGDLGFLDEDGEVYITGRKKDILIVHGKNIYPQDVEYVASEVPGVYSGRTVCFGVWDDELGTEELYVVVERVPNATPTPIKIAVQKAVMEEVGTVPKRVEVVEHMTLVKTSSGKISRARNKELYLNKGFSLL
ncbi:AMP-binding protein [Geomonas subterranea]|uniref:AMP-binding protein n=1 Tax=Geomonas subterranea TaxID=2847989 RepID=A0ABX8LJ23_9BACT|nr:AMP-binding protein [Geomonas subterranea]QXE90354.1 AMP-binding protein [Geomonas subterranea]QXM07518.1 AMP-binding protein [Geomonas subterranea]